MKIKLERPIDYLFMRAKIRAEYDWSVGDMDIEPPADIPNFDELYYRL